MCLHNRPQQITHIVLNAQAYFFVHQPDLRQRIVFNERGMYSVKKVFTNLQPQRYIHTYSIYHCFKSLSQCIYDLRNTLMHSQIFADSSNVNTPLFCANVKKLTRTFSAVFSSLTGGMSTSLASCVRVSVRSIIILDIYPLVFKSLCDNIMYAYFGSYLGICVFHKCRLCYFV